MIKNSFYFSIISDTHVLARELMIDNKDFETFTKFDRKLLVESEALLDKSLKLVDEKNSSYLFVTGDMTKDGEKISHKKVSEYLKNWKYKNKDKERKIFIIPGNHDINNTKAFDYNKNQKTENITPKDFLDIYDFCYEDFSEIKMYKDSNIFKSYLSSVNETYNTDKNTNYYAHGYLSYIARIKQDDKDTNGISVLALDTSIYSCDFESSHSSNKENVVGYLEKNQMIWACDMIKKAKEKKDLIILIAHHAIIPNFRNQELVFGPFIIKNWAKKYQSKDQRLNNKTPIEVLADMGIKFIFTGHLHENGTAKYKSSLGNEIFNIQTGSPVTYPLPIRHIKVIDDVDEYSGFSLNIKTEFIKSFSYINLKNEKIDVKDATIYTLENQLSLKDVIFNYVRTQASKPEIYNMNIKKQALKKLSSYFKKDFSENSYVNELFPYILKFFPKTIKKKIHIETSIYENEYAFIISFLGSKAYIKASNIKDALENIMAQIERKILIKNYIIQSYELIVKKIISMPLYDNSDKTIYDFINYIYQYKAIDEENRPDYIDKFIEKLKDPNFNLIDEVLYFAKDEINHIYDQITKSIVFKKDSSKKKFFEDLIVNTGLVSKIAKYLLISNVDNLNDLIEIIAMPILGKKNIDGLDVLKYILHHKKITQERNKYAKKKFGTGSLRDYVINLIMSMSNELTNHYQNEDFNQLDHYFNYIEYDEYENK